MIFHFYFFVTVKQLKLAEQVMQQVQKSMVQSAK